MQGPPLSPLDSLHRGEQKVWEPPRGVPEGTPFHYNSILLKRDAVRETIEKLGQTITPQHPAYSTTEKKGGPVVALFLEAEFGT